MKNFIVVLLVSNLCLYSVTSAAQVCTVGHKWRKNIKVMLQHGMENHLCKDDKTPCTKVTSSELIATVKHVLNEFHENTAANLNLTYDGRCFLNPEFDLYPCGLEELSGNEGDHPSLSQLPPDRIVIHTRGCLAHGYGNNFDTNGDGYADKGFATICNGSETGVKTFGSYIGEPNKSINLQGILLHELGHAVGLGHPNATTCGAGVSMMGGHAQGHPTRFDANKLQELYGVRTQKKMNNAVSSLFAPGNWSSTTTDPLGDLARTRFTACDVAVSDGTLLALNHHTQQTIYFMRYGADGSIAYHSSIPSYLPAHVFVTNRAPAIACKDEDNYRVVFSNQDVDGKLRMFFADSHDGGLSWNDPIVAQSNTVPDNEGVEATWDPASEQYIYVSATSKGKIATHVMYESSGLFGYAQADLNQSCTLIGGETVPTQRLESTISLPTTDCIRTSGTPTLACGDPTLLGDYNCMMIWAGSNWHRTIHYAKAKVVNLSPTNKKLELKSVNTLPWVTVGSPSLAIDYHNETPWLLSFHNGNRQAIILRAAAEPEALWPIDATYGYAAPIVSPTLGVYYIPFWFFRIPATLMTTTVSL